MEIRIISEVKNLSVSEGTLYVFGNFGIALQSKVSNYGTGKKTVYSGYITENVEGEEGESIEVLEETKTYFSNYEITKIQKLVGYVSNGSIKTLTDEEIESAVDKKLAKAKKAIELLTNSELATPEVTEILNTNLATRKSEMLEEYKKKRDERKDSLEASEAKKKLNLLQKKMIELTKEGDFINLAILAQELAKAQKQVMESEETAE